MKKMMLILMAAGSVNYLAFAESEPTVVNKWKSAVSGDWGDENCWSLGHVPTESEKVFFPNAAEDYEITVSGDYSYGMFYADYRNDGAVQTITFKGTGSLTAKCSVDHCLRTNRRLVINGPTFRLTNRLLNYCELVVNSGSYESTENSFMWGGRAKYTLNGGEMKMSALGIHSPNGSFEMNGGTFTGNLGVKTDNYETSPATYVINGGQVSGNLVIYSTSTFRMSGGRVTSAAQPNIGADVNLELNGGELVISSSAAPLTNARLLSGKTAVTLNKTTSQAVQVFAAANQSVAVNGCLTCGGGLSTCGFDGVTWTGDGEIRARNFVTTAKDTTCTISLPKIVLGNAGRSDCEVFYPQQINCVWRLVGPMQIGASSDWTLALGTTEVVQTQRIVLDGSFTVNTLDAVDSTTVRTLRLRNLEPTSGTTLSVVGGGTFEFSQTRPFAAITVGEGTTLRALSGTIRTERLTVGKNAALGVVAGSQCLVAENLALDAESALEVEIPAELEEGCHAVLQVGPGAALPSDLASRVTLSGDTEGWSVVVRDEAVYVKKIATAASGAFDFEWIGGGADANWSTDANWYGGKAPTYANLNVLGVSSDTIALAFGTMSSGRTVFDNVVTTVGQIRFLEGADTFTLVGSDNSINMTLAFNTAATAGESAGVYSLADTPQYVDFILRGKQNLSLFASGRGALVHSRDYMVKGNDPLCMRVSGDVRLGGTTQTASMSSLALVGPEGPNPTRLTVLPGRAMTFAAQKNLLGSAAGTCLRVCTNGVLKFSTGTGCQFGWQYAPADNVIDGQLDVNSVLAGSVDQAYGGRGTMNVAGNSPGTTASCVTLFGTLTLRPAQDWLTVSDETTAPMTLAAKDSPVLELSDDWSYGPATDAQTETEPSARALTLADGAVLTLSANGHRATLNDPFTGTGSLVMTNGVLSLGGTESNSGSLSLTADAVVEWAGDRQIGSLTAEPGATLRFTPGAALSVAADAAVDGVRLEFTDSPSPSAKWFTILAVEGTLTGLPVAPDGCQVRVVQTSSGQALQCRVTRGLLLIIR